MEKIGFIGVGNMGGALAQVAAKTVGPEHLLVSSRTLEKAQVFAAGLGAAAVSNAEVAAQAEMIFLGVKPQKMAGVLEELKSILAARQDRFVLVSMAAGLTTNQISTMAGGSYPVLRIMPNTPAKIGKGVIVYCGNDAATPEDFSALYLPEWGNALYAPRRERDVLAVGAYDGDRLIGLAGCSADCETMWQIGVDVLPEYRRRGAGSAVTARLALETLDRGKVPFYCCAWSNIRSARNAIRSGFRPAWAELTVKPAEFTDKLNK